LAVAGAIRTAARAGVDRRRIGSRRERQARLKRADAVDLPAAERVLSRAAAAQPSTPLAEGQRVIPGDGQTMADVERRIAAVGAAIARVLRQWAVGAAAEALAHGVNRMA